MTWAAVAVAGGAIAGGLISSAASRKAASTQAGADISAQQMQKQMFEQIIQQEQPFLKGGYSAETLMQDLLGQGGPSATNRIDRTLQNLPGYKFIRQQGDLGIQAQGAATGSALGGATLKALDQYNTGLANSYYQNFFNNAYQSAALGQNAAGNLGNSGTNLGIGGAQAIAAAGGASAAGTIGSANALSGAVSSIPLYLMMSKMGGGMNSQQGDYAGPGGP